MPVKALAIYAGPTARQRLREQGLRPQDVRVVPGAAGGPKGLILNAIDRVLLGDWLLANPNPVHLIGSSVGAWRLALACLNDPQAAFRQWAHDYIHQDYPHEPGRAPTAATVSRVFADKLREHVGGRENEVLTHPSYRLHVITARGRHVLRRDGRRGSRLTTPLGYLGAMASNLASRRAVGHWLERVVFGDARDALPLALDDLRTRQVALSAENLQPSILASCSIPFWLLSVRDIPGGPTGAYWDGGITDYHLHLPYSTMTEGLVVYPHFQRAIVPGWLDKSLKRRHRPTPWLDNVVVLAPSPEWVATLPHGKIPDRADFKAYGDDIAGRQRDWLQALRESERLGDELREQLQSESIDATPLQA